MANLVRENIDRWFEHNLDVDNRTLYMGSMDTSPEGDESGVDTFMAEYFIKGMHVLQSKNQNEITILMNNPGGDPWHGMAIYDAIKMSPCPCTVKVYGYAMSMGSIILQAADHRVMMPNSKFMIHYGYSTHDNHALIVRKWVEEEKRLDRQMEDIYLDMMLEKEETEGHGYLASALNKIIPKQNVKTPTYTFSKVLETKREQLRGALQEMLKFDTILNAEETVALGFADEIFKQS